MWKNAPLKLEIIQVDGIGNTLILTFLILFWFAPIELLFSAFPYCCLRTTNNSNEIMDSAGMKHCNKVIVKVDGFIFSFCELVSKLESVEQLLLPGAWDENENVDHLMA